MDFDTRESHIDVLKRPQPRSRGLVSLPLKRERNLGTRPTQLTSFRVLCFALFGLYNFGLVSDDSLH